MTYGEIKKLNLSRGDRCTLYPVLNSYPALVIGKKYKITIHKIEPNKLRYFREDCKNRGSQIMGWLFYKNIESIEPEFDYAFDYAYEELL